MKAHPRIVKVGVGLGMFMPMLGMSIGLQASATIGNILLFPFILVSMVNGTPFGMFGIVSMLLGFTLSIILYTLLVVLVVRVFKG